MAIEKVIDIQVNSNFDTTETQLKELTTALKQVDKEATNLDATFEEIYGDLKPLTARMGEAEDRLYELAKAGKQGSQEYKDLLKSVGEYKRVQQQTDLVVDAAAQTMGSKLTGSLNAAAGGFSLAQGSMALFGSESSSVEAAMLKVQSAMAISQGFETINQSTKSVSALATTVKSYSIVQKLITAGQWLWNAAMNANPLGAIVLAITAVIAAGYGLIKFFGNVAVTSKVAMQGIKENSKALEDSKRITEKHNQALKDGADYNLAMAKASGKSAEEIRKLSITEANADISLKSLNRTIAQNTYYRELNSLANLKASGATDEAIKMQDELTKKSLENFVNENKALSESIRNKKLLIQKNNIEIRQEETNHSDKIKEQKKTIAEKNIADAEAEAKKIKEEKDKAIISEAEAYRNQLEAVQKVESDAKKSNANALLTEQELAIQTENEAYQIKLQNAAKFGEQINEIERQHLNTLNDINLTAQQKQYAEDKANSEAKIKLIELEKKSKLEAADAVANTLSAMSDLLGKETAAGKTAAVASATINTFSSAQKAYDATVGIPFVGPVLAPINAGIAIAAGIKNVKSILAVKVPGGGGGGSAPSGGAMAQAGVTAPSFNVVGSSSTNQLAQTIGQQQQQPIQAYVVANNVTTAQALNRNIIESATIGG